MGIYKKIENLHTHHYNLFGCILLVTFSLEAEGKDMKAVMDTWTKQLGYPVVTTRRINATHLEVEQKRFSLDSPGVGKRFAT